MWKVIIVNLFLFSFISPLLSNIEIETNNHSNITFLGASKHKN